MSQEISCKTLNKNNISTSVKIYKDETKTLLQDYD